MQQQPNQLAQTQQELQAVKARAFDLQKQIEQQQQQIGQAGQFLQQVAQRLGVEPVENMVNIDDIFVKLDALVTPKV